MLKLLVLMLSKMKRLIDGTVFDSSYRRGEPTEFPVNGVIQGWQIALKAK